MNRSFAFQVSLIVLLALVFLMSSVRMTAQEGQAPLPEGVSGSWWSTVQQNIREEEYNFSPTLGDKNALYQAPNRAQGFRSYFNEKGVRLVPRTEEEPSWDWGLELVQKDEGARLKAKVKTDGNRIEINRGDIVEWYVNGENGLEQGFIISNPLPGMKLGKLNLDMNLTGNLRPKFAENGQSIDFYRNGNFNVIRYSELIVTDAASRVLPSKFEGISGGIRIAIDDKNAVYPITVDPLAASPSWASEGDQDSAGFGCSVATAGDVNGDGYSDVIVGAYLYDTGVADAGRIFVYCGSESGLGSAPSWTAESDQENPYFGASVATAGDVNGDGYSDIIVGAVYYDSGEVNEGKAFAWYGSSVGLGPAGTPANADWTAESDQVNAYFGCTVSTAGDVNGDGYSDIIVGAYQYSNVEICEGRAFVFHGSASGLSASADWTAECNQSWAYFGNSVGTAGDVNGDGYSDVLVGATYYNGGQSQEGRAFAYHGSPSGLGASPAWTAEMDQASARFGSTLSTAGDVNGDGYSDVIIGAYVFDNGQTDEGKVFVFHGSASGLNSTTSWTAEGDQASANFGSSVSTAGDVNGDGYADIIVGAQGYDNGESDEGRAFFFLGSATGLSSSASWTFESDQAGGLLGCSVATAGDVNGDGFSDVVVGAFHYDNGQTDEGRAFVFHGSAAGPNASAGWTAEGNQASAYFGQCVESAGDVNGDGYSDVIVGAYLYDNGQSNEGRVFVYLGSPTGLNTVAGWTAESNIAGTNWGSAVSCAGDVNGDGYSDVIVGCNQFSNGATREGAAYLWYGSSTGLGPSGTPGNAGWAVEGGLAYSYFGNSVAGAGDINGDGFGDIIVGAYGYYAEAGDWGRAYLYHGSASGLSTTANWIGESGQDSASYGYSVATSGDVNGDGFSDVVIGAPQYDNGESGEGRAFLYYGSPAGLGAATDWTAESDQAYATLGRSVGTAGDVNGDGFSDLILGVPYYDNGVSDGGMAFIWYGSASGMGDPGTPANADWSAWGGQSEGYFGWDVGSAGDVNGDGYSDVMIGEIQYSSAEVYEGRACIYLGSASGLSSLPALTLESNQESAYLGWSVASAGDVNGDGFGDILVGVPSFDNGSSNEGAVFLHYGNGARGIPSGYQQYRSDLSAPIRTLGASRDGTFNISSTGRSPFGRGKVMLEWQVAPLGGTLDPEFNPIQAASAWTDSGVSGSTLQQSITLPVPGSYFWRIRTKYDSVIDPFQGHGPWLTPADNGLKETDIKFCGADLAVSQTDSQDPIMLGSGNITYLLTVTNSGPIEADVTLSDTIPAGATFVSAEVSQGTFSETGGVVSCDLGTIYSGGNATVEITVTPSSTGSNVNHADVTVTPPTIDPDPADNSSDETTTVNAPAIGNFVWSDIDADGIQDAGETGMAGVVVKLYDGTYSWLAEKVTNASGFYQFTGLTYGNSYFIKVIPPSANYTFSQPNQGGDDTLDSDMNITTGQTPIFSLVDGLDPTRWDAGMIYGISCEAPDEPVWIYLVTLSDPDGYPILNFQDPNQPTQRTGYHIRRSDDPSVIPKTNWPLVATNVVDMDEATSNIQWTDTSGDVPGSGTWYYLVTAYNAYCPAEGPFSSE